MWNNMEIFCRWFRSNKTGYSIRVILTVFSLFLVWVTFRRLTLECCHSAGIPNSGALFWFDFLNLRHLQMWNNIKIFADDSGSYENKYSILLILNDFEVFLVLMRFRRLILECCHSADFNGFSLFLVWVTFHRLALECCHSAGILSSGALFDLIFWICDACRCEATLKYFADDFGKLWKWTYHLVDFERFWNFSCLSDVPSTGLGMLSFCWDSKFRCPFWFDFRNLRHL